MAGKMEVDGPGGGVMASTSCPGSVSVSLHPLVIMNISEHWTRVRAQEGKPTQGTSRSSQYDSYCVEAGKYIRPWLKVISNLCYVSYFNSEVCIYIPSYSLLCSSPGMNRSTKSLVFETMSEYEPKNGR